MRGVNSSPCAPSADARPTVAWLSPASSPFAVLLLCYYFTNVLWVGRVEVIESQLFCADLCDKQTRSHIELGRQALRCDKPNNRQQIASGA